MKRDDLFQTPATRPSDFEFSAEVAEVFDDMIARSVPFYGEQQRLIEEIAKRFCPRGRNIYDLGCATGTTLINLRRAIPEATSVIGYDNSLPMLEQAKLKLRANELEDQIELRWGDLDGDLLKEPLENAGLVTLCWTLQFIRPLRRDRVIRWICQSLPANGALIMTEKIVTGDSRTNRFFIDTYYNFKRHAGYTDDEIARKREALENVLIPCTMAEHLELLRQNGFESADPFFQWCNFAAFLCLKKSA